MIFIFLLHAYVSLSGILPHLSIKSFLLIYLSNKLSICPIKSSTCWDWQNACPWCHLPYSSVTGFSIHYRSGGLIWFGLDFFPPRIFYKWSYILSLWGRYLLVLLRIEEWILINLIQYFYINKTSFIVLIFSC